jgi:hypothetical protein|tara:strand:- start:2860 stop:3174 length:315 start_codon:yes stop_codon:yes gene_type:complete
MPFEPGHKFGLGRPKNSKNRSSLKVKNSIALLLENNMELLQKDLDQMNPRDRVNSILQLLKFNIPTMKSIEVEDLSSESSGLEWMEELMSLNEKDVNDKLSRNE